MKAVIMAGGEGKRLRPLTCDIPKPMVPLLGKPVMAHQVEWLNQHGFADIEVTLGYLPHKIETYFENGAAFGVQMHYHREERPLGTAGGVKNALREWKDGTVLVCSGDAVTDIDLTEAMHAHRKSGAAVTILLKRVDIPVEYGVVVTNAHGFVERFVEKPDWERVISDTVNTGIYLLEPQALSMIPQGEPYDFSKDLFPMLLQAGQTIYGHCVQGYWCDIGNAEQYLQAHWDVLDGKCRLQSQSAPEPTQAEQPVWIGRDVQIGQGCTIGPYTVLGDGCTVGANTKISHSIVWDQVSVASDAELRGTILCSDVKVGRDARLFEGSVVGNGTALGERTVVKPGVKIWPGKQLGNGTTAAENIVWGSVSPVHGSGFGRIFREMTPHYAALLGGCIGRLFRGGKAYIACCADSAAAGLRLSLMGGMSSSGLKVYDLGEAALPSLRYSLMREQGNLGLYVCAQGDTAELRLMDAHGQPLSAEETKKLADLVGKPHGGLECGAERASARPGADTRYALALGSRFGCARSIMVETEDELIQSALRRCGHIPVRQGGVFRIAADRDGEGFTLYFPDGVQCTRQQTQALKLYAYAYGVGARKAFLPKDAAMGLQEYLKLHRLEETERADMDIESSAAGFACALSRALAVRGESLWEALYGAQEAKETVRVVPCEPCRIGSIMRLLWEWPDTVCALRGLAIPGEESVISVMPDISRPGIVVAVSAWQQETAEELAGGICSRIQTELNDNLL